MLVVAVLFPCWEVLDVQGPFSVLAKVAAVSESSEQYAFAWVGEQTKEPIPSSAHFPVLADYDWDSCPQADVLLIPGGPGSLTAAFDRKLLDFVRRQSKTARRVASICTGSSILAEAGLLDGRRATSNKAVFGLQTQYGKSVTWIRDARYVTDGKFTTASGVSAGLDIGFDLAKELFSAVQADKVAGLVGYVPLSDGDDPFATLHKPTGPWADYLYFKATTLVASSVVRERTDLQGQATTSRLPSLPLTFFSKRKSNTIKVLLFPGFDSLDVAGILEACFGLASTHIVELVAMQGVPPANADELVVTGGDSSARNANQSKIVRVRCDSAIHAPIDALPKDWTSSVILVPSVPPEKYVQLEASLASGLEDLLRGSAAVLACGEAMVRLLQSRNTLSEQVLNEYNGPKRWGQDETGKLFVAQTGVTPITPMLAIIRDVAGAAAARDAAMEMEIAPNLMPDGVTLA